MMKALILPLLVALSLALSFCGPQGPDPKPAAPKGAARADTLETGLVPADSVRIGGVVQTPDAPGFHEIFGRVQDSIRYPLPRITMQFAINAYRRPEQQRPWRQRFGLELVAGRMLRDELCALFEIVAYSYYQGQLRPGRYKDFAPYLTLASYVDCDAGYGICTHIDTASYIQVHAVDFVRRKVRISYDMRYYRLPSEVSPRDRHLPMSYRFTQNEPIVVRLVQ